MAGAQLRTMAIFRPEIFCQHLECVPNDVLFSRGVNSPVFVACWVWFLDNAVQDRLIPVHLSQSAISNSPRSRQATKGRRTPVPTGSHRGFYTSWQDDKRTKSALKRAKEGTNMKITGPGQLAAAITWFLMGLLLFYLDEKRTHILARVPSLASRANLF